MEEIEITYSAFGFNESTFTMEISDKLHSKERSSSHRLKVSDMKNLKTQNLMVNTLTRII